ncbi:MAG TPA: NAD(P)/FAD-dependent oxidoreductase [Mycobacteriales bacterium]|nr:NAD(P)/FAD-dependent oxidoreductase [Mycobacteriales bacterium]
MRRPRFAVVGAGMAGLLAAIKLREAGYSDVTVYEKAAGPGGTWRANTYPGIACDVPSALYSYSFAPNPDWSHLFAPGPEILQYFEGIASQHGLDQVVQYGVEVTALRYDEGGWQIHTTNGADRADFVLAATGVLHHPAYPDIGGLETFAGPCFHTAQWDHTVRVDGARVGVLGTGSSGVQVIGAIADRVSALTVFQRTAQWVLPVDNPAVSPDDQQRYRDDPGALPALRAELAKSFAANFADVVVDMDSPVLQKIEELCLANLYDHVRDPALREKLLPTYRAACKRLVVSPNYYRALTRPNVEVVVDDIAGVEPAGVRMKDGVRYEIDVLVLATGFRVDRFLRPIDVIGRAGLRLDDVWAQRPTAYLGVSVPEFPNLFLLNGPNGPVGNFSLIDVAEMQVAYVLALVAHALDRKSAVSARLEAAHQFEADRVEATKRTVWVTGCRSWYLDDRGIPAAWPWTMARFRELMASPELSHFELAQ